VAALSYIEERKKKNLQDSIAKESLAVSDKTRNKILSNLEVASLTQSTKTNEKELKDCSTNPLLTPQLGKPEISHKYRLQWSKSINLISQYSPQAAKFLSESSGLFNVENTRFTIIVTVEVLEEGLKLFRSEIKGIFVTSSAANSANIATASPHHSWGIPASSGVQPLNRPQAATVSPTAVNPMFRILIAAFSSLSISRLHFGHS
jgi:hypothetical protein